MEAVSLINQILKKRLQGVIITEHNYLWSPEEIEELRNEAEVDKNFLILAGQEAEIDSKHILVFGADRTLERGVSLSDIRREFPKAVLIWAHPFRNGRVPDEKELLNPFLDAIEIFNGNHTTKENYLGLSMWHKYKFNAVAGSDAHDNTSLGLFPTQFDHPVCNIEEASEEIRKGRCRPFLKEIPKAGSNIVVTEVTIGTKGEDEKRNRIVVKAVNNKKAWNKVKKTQEIISSLYEGGFSEGIFRVPKVIDVNDKDRVVIEEGQRGKSLYELLVNVNQAAGVQYFKLAAGWLAKLHNTQLRISKREETIQKEKRRFESYRKSFIETNNSRAKAAGELIDFVREAEEEIFEENGSNFIQNHGDYHPKNIIVGQDRMQDISTLFISVIDFAASMVFPPAFDVAYFLAQFQNQFFHLPEVRKKYKEKIFLDAYRKDIKNISDNFEDEIILFKIRANLSIASYLIRVGKGESDEIGGIISSSQKLKSKYKRRR